MTSKLLAACHHGMGGGGAGIVKKCRLSPPPSPFLSQGRGPDRCVLYVKRVPQVKQEE